MALLLLFVLKLGHLGGYCLHIFRRIVRKTITSKVFLYLAFANFTKYLVGSTDGRVINHSIVLVFVKQVIKGGMYRYVRTAFDSETQERMVVYQALYGEMAYWVRPEKMFFEKVTRDGKTFNRFTEIDG